MYDAGNMDEGEVESEDGDDPPIDAGRRCYVWVRQHALDIPRIHLYDQAAHSYEVYLQCMQCAK